MTHILSNLKVKSNVRGSGIFAPFECQLQQDVSWLLLHINRRKYSLYYLQEKNDEYRKYRSWVTT